jgi:hypothetical protein
MVTTRYTITLAAKIKKRKKILLMYKGGIVNKQITDFSGAPGHQKFY